MKLNQTSPAYKVLDIARFAPSGDNIQPWKFKILSDNAFEVHLTNCSDWMIYDKLGTASLIAMGAMVEYIAITCAQMGLKEHRTKIETEQERLSIFKFDLTPIDNNAHQGDNKHSNKTTPSSNNTDMDLFSILTSRTVQRKSMGTTPLTNEERALLVNCLPEGFSVELYESDSQKNDLAKLLYGNGFTRYAMEEGYETHSEAIDWRPGYEQYSPIKIPPRALGMNALMVYLTKWSLSSWPKFHFIEKYLGGTILPRLLMDYRTALKSTALFIVKRDTAPKTENEFIDSGRAMVRFWLMANKLGLGYQPQYTPVLFAEYLRANLEFTKSKRAMKQAKKMNQRFVELVGKEVVDTSVYMGRIGRTPPVTSRSTRLELSELLIP